MVSPFVWFTKAEYKNKETKKSLSTPHKNTTLFISLSLSNLKPKPIIIHIYKEGGVAGEAWRPAEQQGDCPHGKREKTTKEEREEEELSLLRYMLVLELKATSSCLNIVITMKSWKLFVMRPAGLFKKMALLIARFHFFHYPYFSFLVFQICDSWFYYWGNWWILCFFVVGFGSWCNLFCLEVLDLQKVCVLWCCSRFTCGTSNGLIWFLLILNFDFWVF